MSEVEPITLNDRYRWRPKLDELGWGGSATVVKARDLRLQGREVALKLLDPLIVEREPAFAQRFSLEAGEVARLRHVNIVIIHDFGIEGSQLYLVMVYLPGGDLSRRLKEHGPYSLVEALVILEPIAGALDYAHAAGLIHRDIKPQNILFAADGRPVLTDLGLAKLISSSRSVRPLVSDAKVAMGTAGYMAPEQLEPELGAVGPAADVFGLAVTLFQMLTGERLFKGESVRSIDYQTVNASRERLIARLPSETSHQIRSVLQSALAVAPQERPQSATGMTAAFRAALAALRASLPDIAWGGEVPVGKYIIGGDSEARDSFPAQTISIAGPYRLAKYPVTNAQFDCFINAPDVDDPRWWRGMPKNEKYKKNVSTPRWSGPNRPREWVTWYQAIAFCRWLDHHLKAAGTISASEEIDLPHEFEWEVAVRYAGNGRVDNRIYPWGDEITPQHANYDETSLKETSDVGRFPAGRQPVLDLYDMSGNVWEWCRNKYRKPEDTRVDESGDSRALRGGSWGHYRGLARGVPRLVLPEPPGRLPRFSGGGASSPISTWTLISVPGGAAVAESAIARRAIAAKFPAAVRLP